MDQIMIDKDRFDGITTLHCGKHDENALKWEGQARGIWRKEVTI